MEFIQRTNKEWVMFDPVDRPPPFGVELLVVTIGGVLVKSPWIPGSIAWCYKPVLPKSVKRRMFKDSYENVAESV